MPATTFTDDQFKLAKAFLAKFQAASKKDRPAVIQQAANAVIGLNPVTRGKEKKDLQKVSNLNVVVLPDDIF